MKVLELAYGVESDGEEKGMHYEKLDILFRQITTMFRKVNCDLIKSNKYYIHQHLSQKWFNTNHSDISGLIDMNGLAASGRILWGAAFCLAIMKTIKVSEFFSSLKKM